MNSLTSFMLHLVELASYYVCVLTSHKHKNGVGEVIPIAIIPVFLVGEVYWEVFNHINFNITLIYFLNSYPIGAQQVSVAGQRYSGVDSKPSAQGSSTAQYPPASSIQSGNK